MHTLLRDIAGVVLAIVLSLLFYFWPQWDPLGTATGQQATIMTALLFSIGFVYLVVQAWPAVQGKVGTSFALTIDFLISALPLLPIVIAVAFHVGGSAEQSFTNLVVAYAGLVVALFDLIVFGGIGSLVNRLTTDFYRGRGKGE